VTIKRVTHSEDISEDDDEDLDDQHRIKCDCRFHRNYGMFCAHIFAVLNALQARSIQLFKHSIRRRWTREYQEWVIPGLYSSVKKINPAAYANQILKAVA